MPSCSSWTTASCIGTRDSSKSLAISFRSIRSPDRSLPVSTRLTTCETTRSFSLTPYFLGMARKVSHATSRFVCGYDETAVPPAAQRLGGAEVVVRTVDPDRELRDAEIDERIGFGQQRVAFGLYPRRAFDGRGVPANRFAMRRQD